LQDVEGNEGGGYLVLAEPLLGWQASMDGREVSSAANYVVSGGCLLASTGEFA
jgi:hypothetical protein